MYTYVQRPGCKKENTATYVYIRGGLERLLAHTYGQGSCTWVGRNGETVSSSCSWGANRMGRNRMRGLERLLAHTYGQGSCTWLGRNGETVSSLCSWGGNGMRRAHGEARECTVFIGRQRNAWGPTGWVRTECVVVFIGRAWTEQAMETRPGVPQNGRNRLVLERYGRNGRGGRVWRTAKRDSTGYCSSPLSTSSSLHGLLFIQPPPRATPPATV